MPLHRRSNRPLAAATCAMLALTGCYSYAPITLDDVRAGMQVRAHVNSQPARPAFLGPREEPALEGEVLERNGDFMRLAVHSRMSHARHGFLMPFDTIAVPFDHVAAVEHKRFSTSRTALVVGASGVAAFSILRYMFGQWAGGTSNPPGGGGAESRIPDLVPR